MYSSFPSTPGRGRSRFSKVLPTAPVESSIAAEEYPALTLASQKSELPPLPKEAMTTMTIPRRPVGGDIKPAKAPSIASVSSVYSDSPGLSRSLSGSSTKDSLSGVDSETGPSPPPPPKDKDNQSPERRPQTPNEISNSISSLNSSPQRTEIWRRRSVKSDRSIKFPDLKLQKSNGSTASPPNRQEQPDERPQLPRSITGRKPVPVRPAPPQPDLMGNKLSKLRKKSSSESSSKNEGPTQQYLPFQRLPTPEYIKTDKQQSATPQVLSPVSPFTPPDEKPPLVPLKSESRTQVPPIVPMAALETVPVLSESPNKPTLFAAHSRESSETLTATSEATVMRPPQTQKGFAAQNFSSQPSPDKTSPLSLPSPVGHSQHFPKLQSPAAKGTVFPGPALDLVHFECYQAHKYMRGTKNQLCPTGCMTCQQLDTEMRWRCTWCCLSICGSCMQVLSSIPGKDLRICLERTGK